MSMQAAINTDPLSWTQLHAAVVQALRHIEPGSPAYITADVLTDELLGALSIPASTISQTLEEKSV